jgi:hypothetical protein
MHPSLIVLTWIVLAVIALVLTLLGVIVLGIAHEPSGMELSTVAPSLIAVVTRRIVGLYVRRPSPTESALSRRKESSPDTLATRTKTAN